MNPEEEIKPGLDILGSIAYQAVSICDFYGLQDNVYCTSSYDPIHHFKSWKQIKYTFLLMSILFLFIFFFL